MQQEPHVSELLPGYALGCLEPAETESVAWHLAHCAQCRSESEAFQSISDQLGLAVSDATASPACKARLLRRISPPETPRWSAPSRWKRLRPSFAMLLHPPVPLRIMVTALIIVALGVGNWTVWQRLRNLEHHYRTPGFQWITLTCTHVVPEAAGQMLISQDGKVGTLTVAFLPQLEPGYRYQVWLVVNERRIPGETFAVNRNGYGVLTLRAPQSLLDCEFEITIEPADGSPEPTGAMVLTTTI
jgi:anti-sigma-K factor RskA